MKIPAGFIVRPGALLLRVLSMTWRYDLVGYRQTQELLRQGESIIGSVWHGEMLPMVYLHRNQNVSMLISQSYDGDIAAGVVHRFGFTTVRGSSSRGGSRALRGALESLSRPGSFVGIVADGPRGPRLEAKPGMFYLAAKSGAHIFPIRVFFSRAKVFDRSWDKFCLPLPFSRCRVVYGAPYRIQAERVTSQLLSAEKLRFEERMQDLEKQGS